MGQKTLVYILQGLKSEGRVKELKPIVETYLGISPASFEEVMRGLWGQEFSLKDIIVEARKSSSKIEEGRGSWDRYVRFLREKMENTLKERVRTMYLTYIATGNQ